MTEQEMGLLANKPAGAFVRSKCACKLLTVSREKFHSFLHLVLDFEQRVKAIAGMRANQNEQLQAQKQAAKAMKEATFNAEEVTREKLLYNFRFYLVFLLLVPSTPSSQATL